MAAPPILFNNGVRLPISAQIEPPTTISAMTVLMSLGNLPASTKPAMSAIKMMKIGSGIIPMRNSISRHQACGHKRLVLSRVSLNPAGDASPMVCILITPGLRVTPVVVVIVLAPLVFVPARDVPLQRGPFDDGPDTLLTVLCVAVLCDAGKRGFARLVDDAGGDQVGVVAIGDSKLRQ